MLKIAENITSLYTVNLVEGEGVGTAYEYYAKLRKLKRFINSIEKPKRILIAGLPEKYGLSMDFFLLGQMLQAETVVVDERPDALGKAQKALLTLISERLFDESKIIFIQADKIAEFNNQSLTGGKFDLALSSEVLQRLDGAQGIYISNLKRVAHNFAIFVPNRRNESHANLSGLNSVYLEELLQYCQAGQSGVKIYDYGYIDMPPFPPGLSRSQEKRKQVVESRLETLLMKGLEIYSLFEDMIPKFIKEKFAHIVYVMAKVQ